MTTHLRIAVQAADEADPAPEEPNEVNLWLLRQAYRRVRAVESRVTDPNVTGLLSDIAALTETAHEELGGDPLGAFDHELRLNS